MSLTSCVVARRKQLTALIGNLVHGFLVVSARGEFMGLFVLDEDFTHQFLWTGKRDA